MDLFRLEGKVALVTGAGSGLGRQFSAVMAEAGADVACADIDEASARAAAAAVQGLGRRQHVTGRGFRSQPGPRAADGLPGMGMVRATGARQYAQVPQAALGRRAAARRRWHAGKFHRPV